MHIGWHRAAVSIVPILSLGVLGTFATAGLVALGAHWLLGFSWITSGLLGAAIAPTDPAVTFSVLERPGDPRPCRHDHRGRVRRERSGRDRADDRDDRARDERRRQLLDRRPRVRDRDGGRCRRGRGRGSRPPPGDAPRRAPGDVALPAAGARGRGRDLRRRDARPRLGLPGRLRRRPADRRRRRAAPGRDRGLPLLAREPGRDHGVRRARRSRST